MSLGSFRNDLKKTTLSPSNFHPFDGIAPESPQGRRLIKYALETDRLHEIPRSFLTESGLLSTNAGGSFPLIEAAERGQLHRLPAELLSEANLTKKSANKQTAIHWAALNGHLKQVPAALLTQKTLLLRASYGQTPLHWASLGGNLHKVPPHLLNAENLSDRDCHGKNALEYCWEHRHIKKMRRVLSAHTLSCLLIKKNSIPLQVFLLQEYDERLQKALSLQKAQIKIDKPRPPH